MRQATPNGAELLEIGERSQWVCWLVRGVPLWNCLVAEPQGWLLQRALAGSLQLAASAPADRPPGRSPGQHSWRRCWQQWACLWTCRAPARSGWRSCSGQR